jgi:hypothetical protein
LLCGGVAVVGYDGEKTELGAHGRGVGAAGINPSEGEGLLGWHDRPVSWARRPCKHDDGPGNEQPTVLKEPASKTSPVVNPSYGSVRWFSALHLRCNFNGPAQQHLRCSNFFSVLERFWNFLVGFSLLFFGFLFVSAGCVFSGFWVGFFFFIFKKLFFQILE